MSNVGAGPALLLLILLGVALLSLLLGLRDPVIAKVGLRSFVRGRRRTLLLVLGLVVGTLIISSSLLAGDTGGTPPPTRPTSPMVPSTKRSSTCWRSSWPSD